MSVALPRRLYVPWLLLRVSAVDSREGLSVRHSFAILGRTRAEAVNGNPQNFIDLTRAASARSVMTKACCERKRSDGPRYSRARNQNLGSEIFPFTACFTSFPLFECVKKKRIGTKFFRSIAPASGNAIIPAPQSFESPGASWLW